jgi:hypothetical protein
LLLHPSSLTPPILLFLQVSLLLSQYSSFFTLFSSF